MHKLVINLSHNYKRLVHTFQELEKVNLNENVTRIIACNEDEAKIDGFRYLTPKAYSNIINVKSTLIIPNYRAVACAMSHIKCWQYIIDNNIDNCLIIEDDIEIINKQLFKINFNYITNIIKENKTNKSLFISMNSKMFNQKDDNQYNSSGILINDYQYNSSGILINDYQYNSSGILINDNDILINDYQYNNNNDIFINKMNNGNYINYNSEIKHIYDIFTRCHFYYINKEMAQLLLNETKNIDYQIDIEIGLLAKKYKYYRDKIFLNIETGSIIQSKKFISSVQFYNITINEIVNIFNINHDIASIIYNHIPDIYKKKNEDFNYIKTFINSNLINNINRY